MILKEEKGKFRPLGIPTAVDRVIQQAIAEPSDEYEPVFSLHSQRLSARAGVAGRLLTRPSISQIRVTSGSWDSRPVEVLRHGQPPASPSATLVGQAQGRTSSLTHPQDPESTDTRRGQDHAMRNRTPQGGPVSPVLANIMLNELDHELGTQRAPFRSARRRHDDLLQEQEGGGADSQTPQALRGGKVVSETQRTKTKICRMTDPEPEVPWVWLWQSRGIVKSTTASEVQGQMQTAPEGHYLTQSRQVP